MDHLSLYVLVMKLFGIVTIVTGSMVLYLVIYHSGKIGKEYKYGLVIHHSLMFLSQISWNLVYIPIAVPPYIAVYPGGFLRDIIPSIILLIFQMSVCMVSVTSLSPLFHLRLLAVLPHDHLLGRPYVKYPLFGYYFIPPVIMNPIIVPFACWDQNDIKSALFETDKVFDELLFDNHTVALSATSIPSIIWTCVAVCGSGTYVWGSIVFITMTFGILSNSNTNLSERTRQLQRKLMKRLIIQTMFYHGFFLGLSTVGSACALFGFDSPFVFITVFWAYSIAFIFGSVLLILTNDGYKRGVCNVFCNFSGKRKTKESVLVVTTR